MRALASRLGSFSRAALLGAGVTAVALVACYAPILRGMADQWLHDEDMGHALLVPVVIVWILWRERDRWIALPAQPSWWGFALLALAAGMHLVSGLGAGLFAGSVAFVLSIAGAVLGLGGFALVDGNF